MCCTKHKINIYSICIAFLLALVTLLPSFSSIHSYITLAAETQTPPVYAGALSAYMLVSEPGYTYYSYNATTNTYTDSTDVFVTTKTIGNRTINVYTIYTTTNITLTKNEKSSQELTYTITSSEPATTLFPENTTQTTIYAPNNSTIQAENTSGVLFEINIVFVNIYTYSTNSYIWYINNNPLEIIDQPENDAVFESTTLTLKFQNAQQQTQNNNRLHVKYTLNGTTYTATYANKDTHTDENNKIDFSQSGNYIVEIYDDTYTPEAQALGKRTNYKKYTFSIENGVYALTYSPENEEQYFIKNQYTNTDVIVSLKGIQESDIYYFKAVNQENVEDVYVTGTLQNSNNFSYTFSQHGNYVVTIYTDQAYEHPILTSEFHIVKELVTTKIFADGQEGVTNDTLDTDTNTHVQTILTTVTTISTENNITTETTYSFTYRYAYSNAIPSFVSNVGNNQRTSGSVTVRPQTTGNFVVQITYNGTTHIWEYNPDDAESLSRTFDAIGTYSLRLTDELGNSITYNFEIYKPMDAASIALIVVSCVIAVAIIIVIIVARTRLNVR